jgi:aryl-alcohol dehydrogenase-like predicted oxidoreductase
MNKHKLQDEAKEVMTQTNQQRFLGQSGLVVPPLGVGTNRWGAKDRQKSAIFETFRTALESGLNFFDTAEVYTGGNSERFVGEFTQRDSRRVIIASKFLPIFRLSPHQLMDALDASLKRLDRHTIDIYYVHFPISIMSIEAMMDMMALAVRTGKIRAVGVSNFSAQQMRRAAARLARYTIPLAANQVQYSLLQRQPETNGVLDACRELDVALVAYRPLAGGLLKVSDTQAPATRTSANLLAKFVVKRMRRSRPEQLATLRAMLNEIARAHGKTVSQVALNWLLQRDEHVIPIPGATSSQHALENAETLTWQLTDEEFAAIDQASSIFRSTATT